MTVDADHFAEHYAAKLWDLIPGMYREDDGHGLDDAGPLRELVARIGREAAIVRRSIDRLWEDQSIETCDDWVIPYIGDLLATNLVASLGGRGQRLDVAKTIYYRRRKGTVAILEELARDITDWDARVVELFRRLGRTRHGLDPAIGRPADTDDPAGSRTLQLAQGLVGPLSGTPIGGFADLRDARAAALANTAFDEAFHTADVRRGVGAVGWYDIPRLGVFLWRLRSFKLDLGTPVGVAGCPGHFTFDPTGRTLPLFARRSRDADAYGDGWASPAEWQLPGPIGAALYEHEREHLYPSSLGAFSRPGSLWDLLDAGKVTVYPELGRLKVSAAIAALPLAVTSCYGFSGPIGAGPYDRRVAGAAALAPLAPVSPVAGGGAGLAAPLGALAPTGTVEIGDSLTYVTVGPVGSTATPAQAVRVAAENRARPVVRPAAGAGPWTFTGAGEATLEIEGLLVSGCDIALAGRWETVTVRSTTLDPGATAPPGAPPGAVFDDAVDARPLRPTTLWIDGAIGRLVLQGCITGPIRTRGTGFVESLELADTIVQAIASAGPGPFAVAQVKDPARLALRLLARHDPLSAYLWDRLAANTRDKLADTQAFPAPLPAGLLTALLADLNAVLAGASIYDAARFARATLTPATLALAAAAPTGADLLRLNRQLLEEAYPLELADRSLAIGSGAASLERCTLLGAAFVHRLSASDSILDDVATVEDAQHGCVRFSAWSAGSALPRRYESVRIDPGAPLFTSRGYGQPGYSQLLDGVDAQVNGGNAARLSIVEGGSGGSEMGAFASLRNPIKERSVRIKYDEFMPLGLTPVIVKVT